MLGSRDRRVRTHRLAALFFAAGVASHCSSCPKDPDASPHTARPLELEDAQPPDTLECSSSIFREPGPDCIDYRRVAVERDGTLEIRVAPRPGARPPAPYRVTLLGEDLRAIARETGAPGDSVLVSTETTGGTYYAAVAVQRGALDYEILAHLEIPVVVIPEPQFRTVVATVVEFEEVAGEQLVVLAGGEEEGLRPGQKGQLLDGERVLAEVEVVRVFTGGSRARIQGRLAGVASAEARAEFQVPVGDP